MSYPEHYFEVARRLLSTPEMSLGGGKIEELPTARLEELSEVAAGGLAWYEVQTTPLEGAKTSEQLVLFREKANPELVV